MAGNNTAASTESTLMVIFIRHKDCPVYEADLIHYGIIDIVQRLYHQLVGDVSDDCFYRVIRYESDVCTTVDQGTGNRRSRWPA